MPHRTLLIVDDEPNILFSLKQSFQSASLEVLTAATAREAVDIVREQHPDVVLMDVRLPDLSGLEAYGQMRQIDPRILCIIMTAYARTETAIEATRRGAFDYLIKPVGLAQLREIVERAISVARLRKVPALFGETTEALSEEADIIVGNSSQMQDLYKTIGRVASLDAPVLILGESGTGKELVARAIYHYSRRREKPFLAINCAALSESLLESELFGHERGAFTGADQRRIGKFEQVNGGTILLDEIGDMSQATQAKALRLLQQQQFERVGGNTTIQTDVRIIAATNKDIPQMVTEGKFRQDLFYRLNVFTIHLPPLRERMSDVPLLATNAVRKFSAESGEPVRHITSQAMEILMQHRWPGNVRELESAMKFALAHSASDVITPDSLPESCKPTSASVAVTVAIPEPFVSATTSADLTASTNIDVAEMTRQLLKEGSHNLYRQVGTSVDRVILDVVMKHVEGNQQQAAELLGISRMTLRSKLRALSAPQGHHSENTPEAGLSDA